MTRSEQAVFESLGDLCRSPGYVHAIANLCLRDNMVRFKGTLEARDLQGLYSKTRIIRTEMTTLIGLLLKGEICYDAPNQRAIRRYMTETDELLAELHGAMCECALTGWNPGSTLQPDMALLGSGPFLREAMFYGSDSAYAFQYRDLSVPKYSRDDDWLRANKGFSIEDVLKVASGVDEVQAEHFAAIRRPALVSADVLPAFAFSAEEVEGHVGVGLGVVEAVLAAFSVSGEERNQGFGSLHEFNVANATPLLRQAADTYIAFHSHSLAEAIYESPYYWMAADKSYADTAMLHRGLFTEEFSAERLRHVFGPKSVHSNVNIIGPGGRTAGEIDVLAVFGNRAIVLQAKSKRLTLESRAGNERQIQDDFKKSVQDSCDQAYECARLMMDDKFELRGRDSNDKIIVPADLKDVYVLCVVSDHYPALSHQVRQFLGFEGREKVSAPFVLDVFTLDVMTEMLDTPLRLLSYVDRRTKYAGKLVASHELTILSYHLMQNLWMDNEYAAVLMDDDIAVDLDVAMYSRREGLPGSKTPDGVLTRFAATTLGGYVSDIERQPAPAAIDLGYVLLALAEDSVVQLSAGADELARRAGVDGRHHDLTVSLEPWGTGLTIHCNDSPDEIAAEQLAAHCHARKYSQRAGRWLGVCISPRDAELRFSLSLDWPWVHDQGMDEAVKGMPNPVDAAESMKNLMAPWAKIGRNAPCPCGSGKKYKKCHGASG